ncbi:chorismate mutase aro7 [Quaeritorhiza haematococci]|nr:chorismate mutase aro7 [Quaeritorhiza haematococci]
MNFSDNPLSLPRIRNELVRLEDTIIFALIERAYFAHNKAIYEKGRFDFKTFDGSFLDYFLHEVEVVHAKVRRYKSPDEYPFTKSLPEPVLPPLKFPKLLIPNDININDRLKQIYIEKIIPQICRRKGINGKKNGAITNDAGVDVDDDGNYGSSATKDVEALQILSRRVHFGKFVAEAKFNDPKDRAKYIELIKRKDREGIEALLTNTAVEEKLLRRLRKKAMVYGQEIEDDDDNCEKSSKIDVDVVVNMYEEFVIPLTKEVEVEYLLRRLDYPDFEPEV